MRFYLGIHREAWLQYRPALARVPSFISHRVLRRRVKPFDPAVAPYAVDSGAFTEMSKFGRWQTSPTEYVAALYRYRDELGPFDFAAPQDKMCERFVLDKVEAVTGRRPTVEEHLDDTVASYLTLCELAPDLPIVPVLQGDRLDHYVRCYELYRSAGVDLAAAPVVGVGSVCRRQGTDEIAEVFQALHDLDPAMSLHGFGVKLAGLRRSAHLLGSADSMAWSRWGRQAWKERLTPGGAWMPRCEHYLREVTEGPSAAASCANCLDFALAWRKYLVLPAIEAAEADPSQAVALQLGLFVA